jgi:phage-related protein
MVVRLLQRGDGATIHVVGDPTWATIQAWIDQGSNDARELMRRVLRVANGGPTPGGVYNEQHIHATGVKGVRAIKMRCGIRLPYVQIGDDIYVIHALKKKRDSYNGSDRKTIGARYADFMANAGQL